MHQAVATCLDDRDQRNQDHDDDRHHGGIETLVAIPDRKVAKSACDQDTPNPLS